MIWREKTRVGEFKCWYVYTFWRMSSKFLSYHSTSRLFVKKVWNLFQLRYCTDLSVHGRTNSTKVRHLLRNKMIKTMEYFTSVYVSKEVFYVFWKTNERNFLFLCVPSTLCSSVFPCVLLVEVSCFLVLLCPTVCWTLQLPLSYWICLPVLRLIFWFWPLPTSTPSEPCVFFSWINVNALHQLCFSVCIWLQTFLEFPSKMGQIGRELIVGNKIHLVHASGRFGQESFWYSLFLYGGDLRVFSRFFSCTSSL